MVMLTNTNLLAKRQQSSGRSLGDTHGEKERPVEREPALAGTSGSVFHSSPERGIV